MKLIQQKKKKKKIWCFYVNILHGSWWNSTTLPLFDEAAFLWKSIIHPKEIFLSAAWLHSFYSKENFHLYCSSPKCRTLLAHISVHSALILQILDSFISQYSPCCVQLYEFAFFLTSLLCHNSASIVCCLYFWPLHFLIFLTRKVGQHCR